ncbi:MAG: hypothetical protein GC178_14530 [Flavobacteriales bacterium]|nr:hypothetical protein [Flavobacteriales bacterium]
MENNSQEEPVEFYRTNNMLGQEAPKLTPGETTILDDGLVEEHKEEDVDEVQFPSLIKRVQAVFVDLLIMLLVFAATAQTLDHFGDSPEFVRGFILVFMVYLYEPFFISMFGGTLGHYLIGLRVKRRSKPDKNVNFFVAVFRFFLKAMLGWLSFLTVGGNKHRRAIHDMVSGSIVLSKDNLKQQSEILLKRF